MEGRNYFRLGYHVLRGLASAARLPLHTGSESSCSWWLEACGIRLSLGCFLRSPSIPTHSEPIFWEMPTISNWPLANWHWSILCLSLFVFLNTKINVFIIYSISPLPMWGGFVPHSLHLLLGLAERWLMGDIPVNPSEQEASSPWFHVMPFCVRKRMGHCIGCPHVSRKSWDITLLSSTGFFIFLFSGHTDLSRVYCHKPAPSIR